MVEKEMTVMIKMLIELGVILVKNTEEMEKKKRKINGVIMSTGLPSKLIQARELPISNVSQHFPKSTDATDTP